MSVASIGYVRLQSTDVNAFMTFATGVMGLMEANPGSGSDVRYLRMDQHPFRFAIEPGDTDRLLACGLEYRDARAWHAAVNTLRDAGHNIALGGAEEAAQRCVSELATTTDPSGNCLELYYGRRLDYVPLVSPTGVSRFVTGDSTTGDMGFGHAVLPAPDIDATHRFYTDIIGLGDADDLHLPGPPDAPPMRVVFMHADNPRQHSVALFNGPHPAGVIHLMVEVATLDEVGLAHDRAKAAGIPIISSLGRHVNDNMFSFYMLAPGGFPIEYGFDGMLVDWDTYTPTVSTEGDVWGHEYNFPAPE